MDLHLSRPHILRSWAGIPDQHRQTNCLYRRMRIGATHRELSRNNGQRFLLRATLVLPAPIGSVAITTRCFLREPTFGTSETMGCGALEKPARAQPRTRYIWSAFLTTRGRLHSARYTTSTGAIRGSWCLQVHIATAFSRRNVT